MRTGYKLLLLSLAVIALMGGLLLWHLSLLSKQAEVLFLNVGQGDAILIIDGSHQILIDGGRSGRELLARIGRHVPFWDRQIELVIATHPDADHIGGFPALLRTYRVLQVMTTGAESETETSRLFQEAIRERTGGPPLQVFRGTEVQLPSGGVLRIEYPLAPINGVTPDGDTNEGSIVSRFTYGETSFLFTGDLPREERVLVDEAPVTVLKVAHHGSKHSSSATFLNQIRPKEAVVSVGENSYGHPDPGVLGRLEALGAIIRRTDQVGDVVYRCTDLKQCVFAR